MNVPYQPGPTDAKVRALILTAEKFEDMELFAPYFRLTELLGKTSQSVLAIF